MALDERARHELFLRLEQVLGADQADTLMELLPPVGWAEVATKRDLDGLEERVNLRFELVDQRFEALDQRFEALDQRFEGLQDKLLAAFRGELLSTVGTQTKTLVIANVGTVLSMAVLAFGAAKLA